jgi:hypothetical protein
MLKANAVKTGMVAFAKKTVDEQAEGVLKAYTGTFAGDFHTILDMAEVRPLLLCPLFPSCSGFLC